MQRDRPWLVCSLEGQERLIFVLLVADIDAYVNIIVKFCKPFSGGLHEKLASNANELG